MSSLVLLNTEGVVASKLQLVSLPDDYVVPEGMTISWRMDVLDALAMFRPRGPLEAYFYLGNAWGQVCRNGQEYVRNNQLIVGYTPRTLTVTVQGTAAKDVMNLRDRIMHLINSGARWEVSNDLNPKPKTGFLRRLFGMSK